MSRNLETTRRLLQTIEAEAPGEVLTAFFHPEVVQREFPNRLTPQGIKRDIEALKDAANRGKRVIESQRYEIHREVAEGDHVAIEFEWSGTLKVALGTLPAGGTIRARCAMFLTFREGLIIAQHSYDCFDAF